jgi:hypothetical protein
VVVPEAPLDPVLVEPQAETLQPGGGGKKIVGAYCASCDWKADGSQRSSLSISASKRWSRTGHIQNNQRQKTFASSLRQRLLGIWKSPGFVSPK